MSPRDHLFDGRAVPAAPAELRRRIRAAIASAPMADESDRDSLWRLLWAAVVLLSLAAHLALDLGNRAQSSTGEQLDWSLSRGSLE